MSIMSLRGAAATAMLVLATTGLAGCGSSDEPDTEPEIGQITLQIGAVAVNSVGGNPPSTATVLPRGNHVVTVLARTSNGQTITLDPTEFELRITSSNSAVASYSRNTALGGTLNAAAAGTATLNVQLYHLLEGHADYQIQTLNVTVQ